jgi:hypothetical protein
MSETIKSLANLVDAENSADVEASKPPTLEKAQRDIHGSCACGLVHLVVPKGSTIFFSGYCHCKSCQKMTSSPVALSFGIDATEAPDFPTVEATDILGFTQITTNGCRRFFCKKCSIYMYSHQPDLGILSLNHIPFDALEELPPKLHVNYGSKVCRMVDGLPKYKEFPPMGPGMPFELVDD